MTCKSMVRCRDLELNSTPQGCDGSKAKVVVGVPELVNRRGRKSQSGSGVAGEDVLNTSTVKTCRLH